ncbi:hypothetical protein GEMRC1_000198 [Eukaryota sp. GEM-RC1]
MLAIFEKLSATNSNSIIQISSHFIDFSQGTVRYANQMARDDLSSLLNGLKANCSIKRVECRGLRDPRFDDLIPLFKFRFVYKSVTDLDGLPDIIDIENGVFCFLSEITGNIDIFDY